MWLTSSRQAISTIRWPSDGSRPVVSVSSTISRMLPPPPRCRGSTAPVAPAATAPPFKHSDDLGEAPQGRAAAVTGRNDEIGAASLFGIRHLLCEDAGEPLGGHARPPQNPSALQE